MNQSEIQKVFDYVASTGSLIRRKLKKTTGTLDSLGYIKTKFNGQARYCHRLIYIWHHGNIPDGCHIDHIDHDRSNNRIENLQALSLNKNLAKKRTARRRKGVYGNDKGIEASNLYKSNGKWFAKVTIRLGEYDTEEDAQKAIEEFHSK
jgi:hypothetical protein